MVTRVENIPESESYQVRPVLFLIVGPVALWGIFVAMNPNLRQQVKETAFFQSVMRNELPKEGGNGAG